MPAENTTVQGTTGQTTPGGRRAANRSTDDRARMFASERQPAPASATLPAAPPPVGPSAALSRDAATGTHSTPAPNEATPAAAGSATVTPHPLAAAPPAEAPPVAGAEPHTESTAAPAGAATAEPNPLTDGGEGVELPQGESPLFGGAGAEPVPGSEADPFVASLAAALQGGDVPRAIREMGARIGQLTGQLNEANRRWHEAERRTPSPQPSPPMGERGAPASGHPDLVPLDQARTATLDLLDVVEHNLAANHESGALQGLNGQPLRDANGQEVHQTAEGLRHLRRQLNERLATLNTNRATLEVQFAQAQATRRAASQEIARQHYAFLWDRSSEGFRVAQEIASAFPGLREAPDGLLVIGRQVAAILAERKGAAPLPRVAPPMARPKATGAPAPVVTTPSTPAPPAGSPTQQRIQERKGKQVTWKDRAQDFADRRAAKAAA